MAVGLVTKAWQAARSMDLDKPARRFTLLVSAVAYMSYIDPARGEQMARKSKPPVPALSGALRADLLSAAAEGLVDPNPDYARVLLDEAERLVGRTSLAPRGLRLSTRAVALVIIATQYARLDQARARALIAEAEKLGRESGDNQARRTSLLGEMAKALATIDSARAVRLADAMLPDRDGTYTTYVAIARHLLHKEPKTAHALLVSALEGLSALPEPGDIQGSTKREELLSRIIRLLAVLDPARAEQAVGGLTLPYPRVLALSRLGGVLAPHDPARSRGYLDEAERITRSSSGPAADRSRGFATVAREMAPHDTARARALIAEAGKALAGITDPYGRGIASLHLAACGIGMTMPSSGYAAQE